MIFIITHSEWFISISLPLMAAAVNGGAGADVVVVGAVAAATKQTCKHFTILSHSTLYLLINVGLMRPYLSNHLV